jgi:acyl-CoA reductase-like NAD-dependent aldehyde dehydrogenase
MANLDNRSEEFSLQRELFAKRLKFNNPNEEGPLETKMSSKPKMQQLQAAAQPTSEETRAEDLFNKQKTYFASDATKTYEWRIDQLDRLTRMLKENFERFADASRKDFKTASQENVFEVSATIATAESTKSQLKEWMKPVEAALPKFLAASGHKGMVYREPYGVTLIICPFNGPLILSLRPAALSAGNPCILKLSEALLATDVGTC